MDLSGNILALDNPSQIIRTFRDIPSWNILVAYFYLRNVSVSNNRVSQGQDSDGGSKK